MTVKASAAVLMMDRKVNALISSLETPASTVVKWMKL
jgi:hypothetical protein